MTVKEFVKQYKEAYKPDNIQSDGHDAVVERAFGDGLTKGLEIAGGFAEWSTSSGYMKLHNGYGATLWIHVNSNSSAFTTAELLSIYLTEKYEKK